jgi:curved DNA-binding protein CbpA
MGLQDAFLLFRRLGVDVPSLPPKEFEAAYLDLAKRYHPDVGGQPTNELMANINAARATIRDGYRRDNRILCANQPRRG